MRAATKKNLVKAAPWVGGALLLAGLLALGRGGVPTGHLKRGSGVGCYDASGRRYTLPVVPLAEIEAWPAVQRISTKYGWPARWLALAIQKESGGQASCCNSLGFCGLLQLNRKAVAEEGYTRAQWQALSEDQQLEVFDRRYFRGKSHLIKSAADVHLALFLPGALSLLSHQVLFSRTGYTDVPGYSREQSMRAWLANPGVRKRSTNPDIITRADFSRGH